MRTQRLLRLLPTLAVGSLAACLGASPLVAQRAATRTPTRAAVRDSGWTMLFDGTPTSITKNWRGYHRDSIPTNWHAEGETLALGTGGGRTAHGDLVTREQYGDFELEYEWKISPGGNSGVIYRVGETGQATWQTGPEMQVLDDSGHADGKLPSHRAGALYDLIVPPAGVARPVGQFNQARIVMRGMHVQQYLNGRLTADLDFASPRGKELVAASKFHVYPDFATLRTGYIALQDHGNAVTFRNVRVRRLDAGAPPGRSAAGTAGTNR